VLKANVDLEALTGPLWLVMGVIGTVTLLLFSRIVGLMA
jgi:hypothetical protein